jgi:hypothetical protein
VKKLREQTPMVGWFDPAQLVRTAIEVVISTVLGRHTDLRLIEALATSEPVEAFDCAKEIDYSSGPFWLDYLSDTGDGWDPTYAVAYSIAQPRLKIKTPKGDGEIATERGRVLVLGGDQVYPIASRMEYARRFTAPFAAALPDRGFAPRERPRIFAIPGNHDWYDSLASFTRLFCGGRTIGGWMAPQRRSYFALKLPHGWWLLGTDVQLAADIDEPQVKFFRKVASQFGPEDRVILCNAEPHWITAAVYGKTDPEYNENNLEFLEEKVLKGRVAVFLAGDLHHYRRHEGPGKVQKITAGGGGAFLHPTHPEEPVRVLRERDSRHRNFILRSSFPPVEESKRMTWGNLAFVARNPKFGAATAVLYVLLAGSVSLYEGSVSSVVTQILTEPFSAFVVSCTIGGYILFTDTHMKAQKWIGGGLHGLSNVAAALTIGWLARTWVADFAEPWKALAIGALAFVGGWLVGPTIMGLYLLISLNVFGRHNNEAFSALAIPDFKHFLRMRIDPDGKLTIFPVGLRRVPRKWKRSEQKEGSCILPDDPDASPPQLIENPIVIERG